MSLTPEQQVDVERLMPKATAIAVRFGKTRSEREAFKDEAFLTLCEAVSKFDPAKGRTIDEYALWRVRKRMLNLVDKAKREREWKKRLEYVEDLDTLPAAERPPQDYDPLEKMPARLRVVAEARLEIPKLSEEQICDRLQLSRWGLRKRLEELKAYLKIGGL